MKSILRYLFISLIIAGVISLIDGFFSGFNSWVRELRNYSINFLFAFVLTIVNNSYFNWLNKRLPWSKWGFKRLVWGALGSVLLTVICLFLLFLLTRVLIFGQSLSVFWVSQRLEWYVFGLIFTLIISLLFHAFYFWKAAQVKKVTEQTVIAKSATAQFDALKNQLDPHFLFNSLNVLVSLIEENPKAATKFTTSLSKVYRYVLEQRNKQLVPIDEELDFARTYISLLKMRFEDSMVVDIPEKATNPALQVVPLSLQLLLENAVKHNIVSDVQPLYLSIYEEGDTLKIKNSLQPKAMIAKGAGVGLQNIASRFGLLSKREVQIDKTNDSFTVSIPMLNEDELSSPQTTTTMELSIEDQKLVTAQKRVREIKEFYDNLLRFIAIIVFLGLMNYFTSDYPWVIFPAIGMSIGVVFNYIKTFNRNIFLGKGWEERKIKALMNDKNF
jgi:sensor histidine kinase YesM